MSIPVYSEVTNIESARKSTLPPFALSIVFITEDISSSLESLNSIFNFLKSTRQPCELIIINLDKATYQYETIFSIFPFVRILFPQEKISKRSLILLGLNEAKSKNVLFITEKFVIKNLNLNILNLYLDETSFGIIIPLIYDTDGKIIPGIVKAEIKNGLIHTRSFDILGTTIPSLYPKYFCFIINRSIFLTEIDLYNYTDENFLLMELGYIVWKKGFIITQARNFKVIYSGMEIGDIPENYLDVSYLIFNIRNINSKKLKEGRTFRIFYIIIKALFTGNFEFLKRFFEEKKFAKNKCVYPIEDSAIFTIINKENP